MTARLRSSQISPDPLNVEPRMAPRRGAGSALRDARTDAIAPPFTRMRGQVELAACVAVGRGCRTTPIELAGFVLRPGSERAKSFVTRATRCSRRRPAPPLWTPLLRVGSGFSETALRQPPSQAGASAGSLETPSVWERHSCRRAARCIRMGRRPAAGRCRPGARESRSVRDWPRCGGTSRHRVKILFT
jgi:hypothetical protein